MTPDAAAPAVTTQATRGAGIVGRVGDLRYAGLIWAAVITAVAFVVLFLRRPPTLLTAEFWADDGRFYQDARDVGLRSLAEIYAGYFSTTQRLAALVETMVPPYWAPVVSNVLALAITALVAAFLATRLPLDRGRRVAIAVVFVLLPEGAQIIGTMSHVGIVLGAFVIGYAFVRDQRRWELVPLALAGLTGPIVLFAAPVYAGRWWLDRTAWKPLLVVAACCAVQLVALLSLPRDHDAIDLSLVPTVLLTRVTHLPGFLGLLFLGLVVLASRTAPRLPAIALWYLVIVIPLAGLLSSFDPTTAILNDGAAPRYFWLAPGLLATLVIIARRNIWQAPALAFFLVLILRDVAIPTIPPAGWAAASPCIGGPVSCVVAVQPVGYDGDQWAVHWVSR